MDTLLNENGHPLPLSSLHLFVPPLRLVSAALWQVVESRTIMDYGLVEEFVVTVLEVVPHLLSFREKVQLIMGLRAQLILELCRCDHLASPEIIQPHLARISNCISSLSGEVSDPKVEATVTNFCKMVETLLVDSKEKEVFFQEVFLKNFGPQYDLALQALLWRFLARLEKLITVPDLREVVLWFSPNPAVLEECVRSVAHPEPLKTLLEYHEKGQSRFHNKVQASSSDKDIFSALSPGTWMKKCVAPEGCPLSSDDEESEPATEAMYIESQPGRWVLVPDWEVPPKRPIVSSVEVEVEQPDEEEEVTVSRKAAVKRPDKKDKRDAAFFFPKTRGGLKPDRIAAMCKRRQLRVLLSRQDITGLPLPVTRTLSLRKGNVLAGDLPLSRKHQICQKDSTGLPLAGNDLFSGPVKRKRGRPRKMEKMGETRKTSPDYPETKPDGSDGPSALPCRTLRNGSPLTEEESASVQVRKRRRVEHSGTDKKTTEKEDMKREILPNHDSNMRKGNLKTKKAGLRRRRKRRRRHPGLASKKEETIVSKQDLLEKDRSGEEDCYIIPEESFGKDDETPMKDSSYIEKPSHNKSLAGLPKARKSAPSSNPFQIKKCRHCPYFHREEEKLQQHMQIWHPAFTDERRRKRRKRHPGLPSKKEETIVSEQDSSKPDRSVEEDIRIIPEESSGKDDETKMEDSRCTEKPLHKKPLASPKARKSAPSSKPFQIKKCRHCPYFYREEEKLQPHMQLWHPACPLCGKTFIDKLDLEKHLQTHGEQSCPRCFRCNREFESSVDLVEHVQSRCDGTDNCDKRDEDNRDNRDNDGECCLSESDHTYHLQNNSDNSNEDNRDKDSESCLPELDHNYHSQMPECVQEKCRVCYAQLSSGMALISHLKIFHIESPYKCFSCGFTSETHQDLKRHQAVNANCFSNMRRCPVCGYVLQQPLDIKRHLVRHLNIGELKCKACPMTFLDLSDVIDHLQWSPRCRAKCYDEGQSPAEGHSESAAEGHGEKRETKVDQGHSPTGNLYGVNVGKKVHNTRYRKSKRPSLVPRKVDETKDKKSTKRPSLVPTNVDDTKDKKSTMSPSLVPEKADETKERKRMKRPSLLSEKVDETKGKKSMKRPSLVPEKADETKDKKSTKRPSLMPEKVDETKERKRMKRPSLLSEKADETKERKHMKRPSLLSEKADETKDKKSTKRPSLVPEKADETKERKRMKRPSLLSEKADETKERKRMKRPSLLSEKADETKDKKSTKRPSLLPERLQERSHKRGRKRPSLKLLEKRRKKVDETRHKQSMKRPSLLPKNLTVSELQQCSECGIVKDGEFDMQRHLKRHHNNGQNKLSDPACFTSSCDPRNRRKKPSQRRGKSTDEGSTLGNTVHTTAEQQPSSDQHILHTEVKWESSGERNNLNGCFKAKDNHSQWGEKMGLYFIRRVDFLTSHPNTLHLLIPTMYNVPEPYTTPQQHVDASSDQSVMKEESVVLVPLEEHYDTTPQQVTSTDQSVKEESVVLVPLEEHYDTTPQQVNTSTDQSVKEESVVLVPLEEHYDTTPQQIDTSSDRSVGYGSSPQQIDTSIDWSVEEEVEESVVLVPLEECPQQGVMGRGQKVQSS